MASVYREHHSGVLTYDCVVMKSTAQPSCPTLNPLCASVIIPAFNNLSDLKETLRGLSKQHLPVFEVVVVDNGSFPRLSLVDFESCGEVRLVTEEKPGSYAARNRGAAESSGDFLLFLDAGCVPTPDWYESAVQAIASDAACIWGGAVRVVVPDGASENVVCLYERLFSFPQERYIKESHFSVTANLFVARALFDSLGGFREDLYSSGDLEFGTRARMEGVPVRFCGAAVVEHAARSSLQALFSKQRRILGGQFILSRGSRRRELGYTTRAILEAFFRPPLRRVANILGAVHDVPLGVWLRVKLSFLVLALHYRGVFVRAGYMCGILKFYPRT